LRLLLDENIPVQLFRRLEEAGHDVEHIIMSGRRGMADSLIRARLTVEDDLVLLTQDTEFLDLPPVVGAVIVSRIPQGLPIGRRVSVWFSALDAFGRNTPTGSVFELLQSGEITAWTSPT
jgi:hypothetical protein